MMSFIVLTVLTFCNLVKIRLRRVAFTDQRRVAFTDQRRVAFTDQRRVAFTDLMKKAAAPDGGWLVWVAML